MRKYLLLLTLLFFAAVKVFPQTTVTINDFSGQAGAIEIPINVANFNDVGAISFKINYDPNILTFNGFANTPVVFTAEAQGGVISLGWFDGTASSPLNLGTDVLGNLEFTYAGGQTNLTFDLAQSEVANSAGIPIAVTFVNSTVSEQGTTANLSIGDVVETVPTTAISVPLNLSALPNETTSVGAISIKINYDTSVLTFTEITEPADPAISANASGGVLTISYFADFVTNLPITFTDVDGGSNLIGNLGFTFNGGYTPLAFDVAQTEIANEVGTPLALNITNGSAGSQVLVSIPDVVVFEQNTQVVIPISTENLLDVGAISLKIQYNAAVLEFVEVQNTLNGITFTEGTSLGTLSLGWFDSENPPAPLNEAGPAVLGELVFNYATGSSDFNFIIAESEIANSLGDPLNTVYSDGSLTYQAAVAATIAEIQTPTGSDDASPLVGQIVTTTGIVTGVDDIGGGVGYWLQEASAEYSGIWVFDPTNYQSVTIGDEVTVTAIVEEYFGLTELNFGATGISFSINSSGNALPAPISLNTGDLGEAHEGVLVSFTNAEAIEAGLPRGDFSADDGSGLLLVNDQIFEFTPVIGEAYNITGIGTYSWNNYKVIPRDNNDIVVSAEDLYTWWEVGAGAVDFFQNDNNARGMAFNHTTNRVLVASRTGAPDIHILDGNTGQKVGNLDMTGVTGGTFPISLVSVAGDGAIYGANLQVTAGSNFKVYRWADESAAPTVAFDGPVNGRTGDSFVAVGEGVGTVIYASGTNNAELIQLTSVDGENFTLNKAITVPVVNDARGGIAPVSAAPDANIWINRPGGNAKLIATDGTLLTEISGALMSSSFNTIGYIEYGGANWIGVTGGGSEGDSRRVELWNVTDPNTPVLGLMATLSGTWNANVNAAGAIDIVETPEGHLRVFQLVTNNGIGAYANVEFVVPAVELQPVWDSYLPDYFGENTERGAAYGFVNEQNRFYVVARNGGPRIAVHDAKDGIFIKDIPAPDPPVGHFPINTADVSDDGVLFIANGVPFGFANAPFTVYRYDNEMDAPMVVAEFTTDARIGDMFSVSGSTDDNSITLYAAQNATGNVVKFTTTDNGYTFTSEIVELAGLAFATNPNVQEDGDGNLWAKSSGTPLQHYLADGTFVGEVPVEVVGTSASKIKYFEFGGQRYVAAYYANNQVTVNERVDVVNVTGGAATAKIDFVIPSIGDNNNGNASGSVDVAIVEGGFVVFIEGANNGIGAFAVDPGSIVWPQEFDPGALRSLIHVTDELNVEVYNDGEIGDNDDLGGIGMEFLGNNGLWRGSVVWGRTSAGYANGAFHNAVEVDDLAPIGGDFRSFMSEAPFDQISYSIISDESAPNPYGLPVMVQTISRPDLNAIILAYGFVNSTAETINDLYGGLFLDFDVNTYTSNGGGYAIDSERMVYVYDEAQPDVYFGATALYDVAGYNVTSYSAADEAELRQVALEYISQPDTDGPDSNGDMRAWIGSAVPELAPGDTSIIGFVLSAGAELIDLRTNMDLAVTTARALLDENIKITDVDEVEGVPTEFTLDQNYPNPFNPTTTIRFGLPSNSQVKLKVFNLLGETVDVITNQQLAAGYHTFNFDASRLASGVYFYSIEASSVDGGKDFNVVKKMMLLK